MDADELRTRTIRATSRWCLLPIAQITLADKLSDLKPGSREPLRQQVNIEFSGEAGIPIPPKLWAKKSPKTVAAVRDLVKERTGS